MYYHWYDDMEPELDPLAGWSNEEELMELIDYSETHSPNVLEMMIKASADGTIHIDRHNEFNSADTVSWKKRWLRKQLIEITKSIETYESVITHNELELKSLQMNLEVRIKDIPYFRGLVNRTRMELKDAEHELANLDIMYAKKIEAYIKAQVNCNMLIIDYLRELYKSKIPRDVILKLESDYGYITENGFDPTVITGCLRNKENPVDSYIAYMVIYNMSYHPSLVLLELMGMTFINYAVNSMMLLQKLIVFKRYIMIIMQGWQRPLLQRTLIFSTTLKN